LLKAAQLKEDIERINRHDLKTPISSVIGLPEFLLKDANLTAEQKETIETIRGAGYQMLNMVNSSLDMYKMEMGSYKPRIAPVDLAQLLRTITTELRELAEGYSVTFAFSLDDAPLPAEATFMAAGEETLLYSMFANLIKNAIEALPQGGVVSVTLHKDELAQIVIHNASAIPVDVREKFFDKYATSGKTSGTGLGTYSAKLIATTLHGDIQFETSEEKGTDIIVTLPLPESAPKPKERGQKVDITKLTFLITDDMQNIRQIVKRTLQQMGATKIVMANDGKGGGQTKCGFVF
jgi:signal transduction histidine kinase